MKKAITIIFILMLAILPLSGCDCNGDNPRLAATPSEEYARLYSLAGNGITFNFKEQPTFSVNSIGTFSGDNIAQSINMSSEYSHDYRKENEIKSYSYSNSVNSISVSSDGGMQPYYDEAEYGFQYSSDSKGYRYLTSYKSQSDNLWSYPNIFGNGDYEDLFVSEAFVKSADRLVRQGSRLFNPEFLEEFSGGKSGSYFYSSAKVKADRIEDFAQWLDGFFPLFYLKDNLVVEKEWKFFDLNHEGAQYSATIEIKTSARMLEEVIVVFNTYGDERTGFGEFMFSARTTFKSGGVTVKDLTILR